MLMRKAIPVILLGLCLLAGTAETVRAQAYEPVPVTISKDKVKIGGKMYYSHIVLERQTLYSISRAYGVTIREILEMNPAVSEDGSGLTKNSIILIPVREKEVEQPGKPEETAVVATGEYRTHTVKWYENLDDIAAQYGVTVKEIMDANGLTSKTIKSRQELKIPVKTVAGLTEPADVTAVAVPAVDTTAVVAVRPDTTVIALPDTVDLGPAYVGTNRVTVNLLLALNAQKGFSNINMDFYSGVLMALKQLESEGVGTTLNVFDITDNAIPGLDSLMAADLVIGPSAPADIKNVLKVAGDSITLISPLDPKSAPLSAEYPNVFHAACNNDYQWDDIADWIGGNASAKVAVLVSRTSPGPVPDKMKAALDRKGVRYTVVSDGSTLYSALRKGRYTDIIIASENELYVTDALTALETLSKELSFNTYAPNKVRSLKELDTDIFYPVRMHLSTAYFVDENDAAYNSFYNRYWDVFQFEPNQFALQGYDVAYYFVKLYSVYSDKWKEYAGEMDLSLMHSDIRMRPAENGALVNKGIRRVVFNKDMTVTLEKPE